MFSVCARGGCAILLQAPSSKTGGEYVFNLHPFQSSNGIGGKKVTCHWSSYLRPLQCNVQIRPLQDILPAYSTLTTTLPGRLSRKHTNHARSHFRQLGGWARKPLALCGKRQPRPPLAIQHIHQRFLAADLGIPTILPKFRLKQDRFRGRLVLSNFWAESRVPQSIKACVIAALSHQKHIIIDAMALQAQRIT